MLQYLCQHSGKIGGCSQIAQNSQNRCEAVPSMTHLSSQSETELTKSQKVFQSTRITLGASHLPRKSKQSTKWPQVGERGSQGMLLSVCETELEPMTGHSSEQHQTGQRALQIPSWLATDHDVQLCNRALSSTFSSPPTPSQLLGVFHPPFKVLEMFFCGFVVSNLV